MTKGSPLAYRMQLDEAGNKFMLGDYSKNWFGNFVYESGPSDVLTLSGKLQGHQMEVKLRRGEQSTYLLTNRGFHWINEVPLER